MLTVDILRSYINISLYCTATEAHIPEAAIGLRNSAHLQWRQALLRPRVSPSLWQGRSRQKRQGCGSAPPALRLCVQVVPQPARILVALVKMAGRSNAKLVVRAIARSIFGLSFRGWQRRSGAPARSVLAQ